MLNAQERDIVEVSGLVERIRFRSDDEAYTVCEISNDKGELITLVGALPGLGEGEEIRASGSWEVHAHYGKQLRVEYYEKQLPETPEAMLRYLSSRAVKGIGPVTAAKIVDKYGADSFEVIENHPDWLASLPGITARKAEEISRNFREQNGIRQVMMFCREHIGTSAAVRCYKRWGLSAVETIKNNPFILCEEISGVGFERADALARACGFETDDRRRVKAALHYVMKYNSSQNGYVCLPEEMLLRAAADMLEISRDDADMALDDCISDKTLCVVKLDGRRYVYLTSLYEDEKYIANKLKQLDRLCPAVNIEDIGRFISRIEGENGITYAAMQRRAITDALTSGVMLLTGGPGTGKTTIIRAVIQVLSQMGGDIALAAPTGRAAKRMSEATQHEASTIHRLLEMVYNDEDYPVFQRCENNLLDEDVIIIDEASMVDTALMASLLRAIKPGARLIMIGDADQLPSIGAGNVLNDLIESDVFATVKLKEIFRQAQSSLIITNAHAINNGDEPNLDAKEGDFFFLTRNDQSQIIPTIVDLCKRRLPATYGADIADKLQVITPSRKGCAGTEQLNHQLQIALNPPGHGKREKSAHSVVFRTGDKVMQIKNDYDIEWVRDGHQGVGIFNGDIGRIESIDNSSEEIVIDFDGRVAVYDYNMLDELEHAYAITIHKSQGSEYPVVIIPVYDYSPKLLTRNLLYTAVTRAQQMVIMVGRQDVVTGMIANNQQTFRYTGLQQQLAGTVEV